MPTVHIERAVFEALQHHAQAESPLECCGLLSGERDVVTQSHPMRNILKSETRYEMDPRDLFQFFKKLRAAQRKHLGIYHSHPHSEAYPSRTDVQESFYPDCVYFIVSLKGGRPQTRAFKIIEQSIQELEILQD